VHKSHKAVYLESQPVSEKPPLLKIGSIPLVEDKTECGPSGPPPCIPNQHIFVGEVPILFRYALPQSYPRLNRTFFENPIPGFSSTTSPG